MIKISMTDGDVVVAFNRLIAMAEQPTGPLLAIGEVVVEFTKELFDKSEDPYGDSWKPNSDTTLRMLLNKSGRNFTKKGKVSARGERVLAGKKPLIGETKSLSTQFTYRVLDYQVAVSSPMIYAAVQQFGATIKPKTAKALFFMIGDQKIFAKSVTIPARPFFPDEVRGMPKELGDRISEVLKLAIVGEIENKGR